MELSTGHVTIAAGGQTGDRGQRGPVIPVALDRRVEALEHRLKTRRLSLTRGELPAGRLAMSLVWSSGGENPLAARAPDAARKRAHAFWDPIGGGVRQRDVGRRRDPHAATT